MYSKKVVSSDEVVFKLPTFILEGNRIQINKVKFPLEFNNLTITQNHFLYLVPVFLASNGNTIKYTTLDSYPSNVSFVMLNLCGQVLNTGTYIEAQDIINTNQFDGISISASNFSAGFNPLLTYTSSSPILPISLPTRYNSSSTFPLFKHKLLEEAVHSLLGIEAPKLLIDFDFNKFNLTFLDNSYVLLNNAKPGNLTVGVNFNPYEQLSSTKDDSLCMVNENYYKVRLPYVFKKIDNNLELLNTAYCTEWNINLDKFLYYNTIKQTLSFSNLFADEFLTLFKNKIVGYKSPNLLPPQRVKLCCSKYKNFELLDGKNALTTNNMSTTINVLTSINLPSIIYYGVNFSYDLNIEVVLGGKLYIYLSDENDNFIFKNNLKCEIEYTEIS